MTKSQPAHQDQQIFLSMDGYITQSTGVQQRKVKMSIFKLISVRCVRFVGFSVGFLRKQIIWRVLQSLSGKKLIWCQRNQNSCNNVLFNLATSIIWKVNRLYNLGTHIKQVRLCLYPKCILPHKSPSWNRCTGLFQFWRIRLWPVGKRSFTSVLFALIELK